MLISHAVTLAEARSYVAALADRAQSDEASVEYERVLLQLDSVSYTHLTLPTIYSV